LRRQVADLSAIYTAEYSALKRAQAQLAVTETAFESTRADILKRIENDYQEAQNKEKLLATAYDGQTREVTGQDEKAIQYNILKREVDSGRQLYDTMLQQTKQSSIASALRASNVRVVDPAEVPERPFSPDFRLNSAIGLFAGLFLSIAVVTIRERADRTLQQPGDIKMWTDLTELGTIPSLSIKRIYGRASVTSSDTLLNGSGKNSVELITWQEKPSMIAEGFRSTLTSILFVGENGSRPRVLVFTSAHASDGKTTVVSNLAIATAEIRRKVLVIDADLRRPRMHSIFGVSNDRGLSDILREELSDENFAGLIQETAIPNLHVLPAGKPTHAASHLLYSRNFAPLLAKFKREYDMILIDTPPMLQMTDARVAGRLADAVILVARAGDTTRDAILASKERLGEDCIRILGTVLNDWNPKKAPGGYYGKYQENYYGKYKAVSKTDV
jgi:succinoglycan biosynthesis transport protein ExoP